MVRNSIIQRPLVMKKWYLLFLAGWFIVFPSIPSTWAMADFNTELLSLQQAWARIKYQTPKAERRDAFASLLKESETLYRKHSDNIDAMVWSAIILYNYAGEVKGVKALGMVKRSYRLLRRAEKAATLKTSQGLIYTVLGHLYYKVPGWPLAFGDDAKAEQYLRKGIELNPGGLDANYFMGDYLLRKKQYRQAIMHLRRAVHAPPRIQRPIADAGRKSDALKLLRQIESQI